MSARRGRRGRGRGRGSIRTDVLTQLVREVLKEVKEIGETFRVGCVDCKKKRDRSFLGLQSRSVKHVKVRPNFQVCEYCRRRHPGECWRKSGTCLRCGSEEHKARDCSITIKSGMFCVDAIFLGIETVCVQWLYIIKLECAAKA